MRLRFRFCEDWLIFAQADDESWWIANTEMWPEWLNAAQHAHLDPNDDEEVARLTEDEHSTERWMLPCVTAWDTELSPTATTVSSPHPHGLQGTIAHHPLGYVGFAAWERVDEQDAPGLDRVVALLPLDGAGLPPRCGWPEGCSLHARETLIDPATSGELSLCEDHARELLDGGRRHA